jgi:uncharacterized Zn-finger protein
MLETSPDIYITTNSNTIWFTEGNDNDLTTILNDIHFNFDSEILFNDNPQMAILPTRINITKSFVKNNSKAELLQCPHCLKTFQYSSRLQRHLTVHQNKQFLCKLCSKFFSRLDVLKTHVARTHKMTSTTSSLAGSSSSSNSESDDGIPNQGLPDFNL